MKNWDTVNFNLHEFIQQTISSFVAAKGIEKMWKAPLTALLSADNPLLPSLRQAVSGDHLLPEDLLPSAKSIIVYFLPFENRIIESNLKGEVASEEWARAYVLTNALLAFINENIEVFLNQHGFNATKIMATHNFDEKTLMSRWSHRHIAWIAGLGTFGINNMLITRQGCCGRFGSLLTDANSQQLGISVTDSRPLPEKCLNKINGSCGLCHKKCSSGAYNGKGSFDRHKCYETCLNNAELYKSIGHADVCGKCLVGLPCSSKDPSMATI